jgi:hypothetical protein
VSSPQRRAQADSAFAGANQSTADLDRERNAVEHRQNFIEIGAPGVHNVHANMA